MLFKVWILNFYMYVESCENLRCIDLLPGLICVMDRLKCEDESKDEFTVAWWHHYFKQCWLVINAVQW